MTEFELISIWRPQKHEGTYINFHSHDYHELVYYANGDGTTTIDGISHNFTNGNFCIIPPNIIHDESHKINSDIFCLKFKTSYVFSPTFNTDTDLKIFHKLKKIFSETVEQRFGYKDMITAQLAELCIYILRNEETKITEKSFEFVINYLKENYEEKLILREFAEKLNYNYDYFQHKFKRITGYSPQQFLLTQRLSAAKKLLKSKDISCTDVAFRCGFSTVSQFSSIFKREFGLTPKQYQRSSSTTNQT